MVHPRFLSSPSLRDDIREHQRRIELFQDKSKAAYLEVHRQEGIIEKLEKETSTARENEVIIEQLREEIEKVQGKQMGHVRSTLMDYQEVHTFSLFLYFFRFTQVN
jgi:hypothetical protein